MTNGDRIRQMTDEEMSEIIMCPYDDIAEMLKNCEIFKGVNKEKRCQECTAAWLRAEHQEEST